MKAIKKQKSCCVAFCNRVPEPTKPNISLHKFPQAHELVLAPDLNGRMKKMKRVVVWKARLRIRTRVSRNMFVCSAHFHELDFLHSSVNPSLRFLKKSALPSLCLPQFVLVYREQTHVGAVTSDVAPRVIAALPLAAATRHGGPVHLMPVPIEVTMPLVSGVALALSEPLDPLNRRHLSDYANSPPGMALAAFWHRAGITLRVLVDVEAYTAAVDEAEDLEEPTLSLLPH